MSSRRSPVSDAAGVDSASDTGSAKANQPAPVTFKIIVRGSAGTDTEMHISGSTPSPDHRTPHLLPPIVLEGDSINTTPTEDRRIQRVRTPPSNSRMWSRYHSGCAVRGPGYLDWTSTKKSHGIKTNKTHKDYGNCKAGPSRNKTIGAGMDEMTISDYLDGNDEFLAKYVIENVAVDTIERWMLQKMRQGHSPGEEQKGGLSLKLGVPADNRKMMEEITESLAEHPTQEQVIWELSRCISTAVGVDGFNIYKVKLTEPVRMDFLYRKKNETEVNMMELNTKDNSIVLEVAQKNEPLRVGKRVHHRPAVGTLVEYSGSRFVMFQPIVQPDGKAAAVLEMWRYSGHFRQEDEEISSSYLIWGGIALHYTSLYHDMHLQRSLGDFLLEVVKSIFQNMVSIESLVTKVMNFAQKLVDADRASLFLVDSKTKELYATVFDIGSETAVQSGSGSECSASVKEIRFPLGTGIAGHVAETGEILNIQNAYEDPRFNRTVDRLTGYTTKTILCMPIYIRNNIIGVVQMVNKRNGSFTEADEKAFEMFAVYCGLALHHAKLYNKIVRSEQKYKVALEVLSYHNTCTEEEVESALSDVSRPSMNNMDNFAFSPFVVDDYQKATHAIFMFIDLFGLNHFDRTELVKFVLTVRKNYRRVPYHNWTHGFSVANSMYNIVKKTHVFSRNEKLALFIGCLCHDLDHRGKSNKFMTDTASPLAAIYSTSTMEHHHFNQTITILQQEGHNIFSKLSSADYKDVLGLVKHCILATDLALFFPNRAKLEALVKDQELMWNKFEHRSLVLAVSMTAADLSASAKPWEIQVETVKVIFQEFYQQGDEEKAAGRKPMAMMDRERPEEQAASQVGFLVGICLPCYKLLHELMPETLPLLNMCQKNLEKWKRIEEEVKQVTAMNATDGKTGDKLPEHLYLRIEKS